EVVYPGTCAHRSVADAAHLGDRPFAWRFRVTDVPAFDDLFRGPVTLTRDDVGGDFVAGRVGTAHLGVVGGAHPTTMPAYQLAVVVDDADNGVTAVVRGDDLVSSTPRQLLLYRALGLAPPAFAHVPLVVGPDGRRLAKRHGDTRLRALREAGVRPEQVVGLLAWSCGWLPDMQPIPAGELLPRFSV